MPPKLQIMIPELQAAIDAMPSSNRT